MVKRPRKYKWWLIIPLALVCVVLVALAAVWAIFGLGNPTVKEGSAPTTTHTYPWHQSQLGNGSAPIADDPCAVLGMVPEASQRIGARLADSQRLKAGAGNTCILTGTYGSATVIVTSAAQTGMEWHANPACHTVHVREGVKACVIAHPLGQGHDKDPGAGIVINTRQRSMLVNVSGVSIPNSDLQTAAVAIAQRLT